MNYSFSRLIVVVENTVEAEQVIKLLVTLHDSAGNDYYDFRANALLDTRVLALSELSKYTSTNNAVRLDDLPYHTLPRVSKVVPSQATILKVRAAVAAAGRVWDVAATNEDARTPVNQRGDKLGPCGFGSVITFDSNSEITQALLAINAAEAIALREGYMMFGIGKHFSQILLVNEAGARAAAEFLTTELGQAFFPDSHLD